MVPFSLISFKLEAIQSLFIIKYEQSLPRLGTTTKLRHLLNIYPDKAIQKLLKKGTELIDKHLDLNQLILDLNIMEDVFCLRNTVESMKIIDLDKEMKEEEKIRKVEHARDHSFTQEMTSIE